MKSEGTIKTNFQKVFPSWIDYETKVENYGFSFKSGGPYKLSYFLSKDDQEILNMDTLLKLEKNQNTLSTLKDVDFKFKLESKISYLPEFKTKSQS